MNAPGKESLPAGSAPLLSVIIPTFNEARIIRQTLDAVLGLRGHVEVIVVDGGSSDETVAIGRARGVYVLVGERGRGLQMHAGACAARGDVLWFLHADTQVAPGSVGQIAVALCDSEVVAGNFCVRFDGLRRAARFLTWLYPHLRKLGLLYGDSALFVRRAAYLHVGGFPPFPLFEDLDLVRRLRKHGRFVHLATVVGTSSRRFEDRNFALTFARWSLLQALYWLGVSPQMLGRWYAPCNGPLKLDGDKVV